MSPTQEAAMKMALEALEHDNPAGRAATITALKAAMAERKPLDDLAIADIYTKWDATPGVSMADFARAIERAHGIGCKT